MKIFANLFMVAITGGLWSFVIIAKMFKKTF